MAIDIGQGNFPILNQSQANPTLAGLANGIAMHLQMQAARANKARLPYVGPQAAAQLQQAQLANQRSQATLPYAGPQAAADLQRSNLANEWFAPEAKAQIAQQNASTQNMIQNALAQKILNQFLPQQQQADIAQKGAMSNYYQSGGANKGVDAQRFNMLKQQIIAEHPEWANDPSKIVQATNAYLGGSTTLPDGSQLPQPSKAITDMADIINLHTNTSQGANQQRYAATLDTAFNSADKLVPSAFKYAGVGGQAKLQADKAAAAAGTVSPDYQAYLQFTRQTIPALASEILRTGGANSTDQQKIMAIQQLNPIAYDSNPTLAKQQFQYLENLYKDIGKTISQSVTQTQAQLQGGRNSASSKSTSNDPLGML
jgi:hypothetical protein